MPPVHSYYRHLPDGSIISCSHQVPPSPHCPVCLGATHQDIRRDTSDVRPDWSSTVGMIRIEVPPAELAVSDTRPTGAPREFAQWVWMLHATTNFSGYAPPVSDRAIFLPDILVMVRSLELLRMFLEMPIHRLSIPLVNSSFYRWIYSTIEILQSFQDLMIDGMSAIAERRPARVSLDEWLNVEWPRLRRHLPRASESRSVNQQST